MVTVVLSTPIVPSSIWTAEFHQQRLNAPTILYCKQELVKVMEETWALVKDIDDAKKLYRKKDLAGGKEYNSEFRKCLSRKFNEVRDKAVTLHHPYGLMCYHAWQDGQIIGVSTSLID
jgi:hypothetical protein